MDIFLNWLWQGGVVALAAAAGLHAIPQARTRARYCFVWAASVCIVMLPAVPYVLAAASPGPAPGLNPGALDTAPPTASAWRSIPPVFWSMPPGWWTSTALALALWIGWSSVHAIRLAAAAFTLGHTKKHSRACPTDLEARLPHWSRVKSTGRRTRVVISPRVRSAAVLGGTSPLIALAPVLIERLADQDIDRVVIHEWAHVQRLDDAGHFGQMLLRTVAGWHPALWWLGRQLDLEREVACDEIAVAVTGCSKRYAACLAALAAMPRTSVSPLPAPAAASSSDVRRRVVRILTAGAGGSAQSWRALATCTSLLLGALAFAIGSVRIVESAVTNPGEAVAVPPTITAARPPSLATAASTAAAADSSPIMATPPAGERIERPRTATAHRQDRRPPVAVDAPVIALETVEPLLSADRAPVPPSPALAEPTDYPISHAVTAVLPLAVPVSIPIDPGPESKVTDAADEEAQTPWGAAADAGVAIGRGSKNAGVAAAGFFHRFGQRVAGSF